MKKYTVYQLRHSDENRDIKFMPYSYIQKKNITLSASMYDNIFNGEIIKNTDNIYDTLEDIYVMLNIGTKPEGFCGHSLSVSDVIKIDGEFYYVDFCGFTKLTNL